MYVYTYMYMKYVQWGWTLEECCLDSSQTPVTLIPSWPCKYWEERPIVWTPAVT